MLLSYSWNLLILDALVLVSQFRTLGQVSTMSHNVVCISFTSQQLAMHHPE